MTSPHSACEGRGQERCSGDWLLYPSGTTCGWVEQGCRTLNCTAEEINAVACGGVGRNARIFAWALTLVVVGAMFLAVFLRGCHRLSRMKLAHFHREMVCGIVLGACAGTTGVTGISLFVISPKDNLLALWIWSLGQVVTQLVWLVPIHVDRPTAQSEASFQEWRANVARVYGVPWFLTYLFGFVVLTLVVFLQVTPLPPPQNLWLFYPFCAWIVSKTSRTETCLSIVFYMAASIVVVFSELVLVTTIVAAQLCLVALDVGLFELRLHRRTQIAHNDPAAVTSARARSWFCLGWALEFIAAMLLFGSSLSREREKKTTAPPSSALNLSFVVVLAVFMVVLEARERTWPWGMLPPLSPSPTPAGAGGGGGSGAGREPVEI